MGSSVSGSIACDPELNRLYCPTGNQQPEPNGDWTSGPFCPELPSLGYSNGLISLDATTGRFMGSFQVPPESNYRASDTDVDVGSSPVIFSSSGHKAVGLACKNGSCFVDIGSGRAHAPASAPTAQARRSRTVPSMNGGGMSAVTQTTNIVGQVPITSLDDLHAHLQGAIALELSTIPPYLCGTWTITTAASEVGGLIHDIAIAEMRHLAIVANAQTATGGTPDIIGAAPTYPSYLADGETEFDVSLLPFGPAFLQQSLAIELPAPAQTVPDRLMAFVAAGRAIPRKHRLLAMGSLYPTIGQFYATIIDGIKTLVTTLGEAAVFPNGGNLARQFPAFNNDPVSIAGSSDAIRLLNDIVDEGEGSATGTIWDENGDLSHYYTFQEITLGRSYQQGDRPGAPTGSAISVPQGVDVRPMLANPRMADYGPDTSSLWKDADAFNQAFGSVMASLHQGFNGAPLEVGTAIDDMFGLPDLATTVLGHEAPGHPGLVAGPTFEIPPYDLRTRNW